MRSDYKGDRKLSPNWGDMKVAIFEILDRVTNTWRICKPDDVNYSQWGTLAALRNNEIFEFEEPIGYTDVYRKKVVDSSEVGLLDLAHNKGVLFEMLAEKAFGLEANNIWLIAKVKELERQLEQLTPKSNQMKVKRELRKVK